MILWDRDWYWDEYDEEGPWHADWCEVCECCHDGAEWWPCGPDEAVPAWLAKLDDKHLLAVRDAQVEDLERCQADLEEGRWLSSVASFNAVVALSRRRIELVAAECMRRGVAAVNGAASQ